MGHEIELKYFDKNGYVCALIRASILVFELLRRASRNCPFHAVRVKIYGKNNNY
jgi:hypothetical protein